MNPFGVGHHQILTRINRLYPGLVHTEGRLPGGVFFLIEVCEDSTRWWRIRKRTSHKVDLEIAQQTKIGKREAPAPFPPRRFPSQREKGKITILVVEAISQDPTGKGNICLLQILKANSRCPHLRGCLEREGWC